MSRDWGFYWLVTFTGPGERAHCLKPGCDGQGAGVDCRHKRCPCTPLGGVNLARWNARHGKRWNHLLTLLKREYPGLQFMRGCEVQDGKRTADGVGRGALHDHLLVHTDVPIDHRRVRALAMQAGFGHEAKVDRVNPGTNKVAEYVSKYVGKSVTERKSVPWERVRRTRPALTSEGALWDDDGRFFVELHDDDGESWRAWSPVEWSDKPTFRAWSSSRSWGLTMAEVVAAGAEYARRMAAAREAAEAPAVDPALVPALGAGAVDPATYAASGAPGDLWRSYVRVWTEPPP
jgi:hypothetical protein